MNSRHFFIWSCVLVFLIFFLIFFRGEIRIFLQTIFSKSADYEMVQKLVLENNALRAELEKANFAPPLENRFTYTPAAVYSRYPFNDRNELLIDKGEEDGIVSGMPVLSYDGVLLGRIIAVERTRSVVQTIFDPAWRSSVEIGPERERAVLSGGTELRLTLIKADAHIRRGDRVVNTLPDFPHNLFLGVIADIERNESELWLSATLDPLYRPEDLRTVYVILDFP